MSSSAPSHGTAFALRRAGGDALSLLPWLFIPYDSLTHLFGADAASTSQTLPLTALVSLPYLLLRGPWLRSTRHSREVFKLMLGAAVMMAILAALNLAGEGVGRSAADEALRLPTAVRQGVSMALGLSTLLMFQDALLRRGLADCMRVAMIGAVPGLMLGLAQIALGSDRVQGFSSEPSHMADMLVFSYLPACAVAAVPPKVRRFGAALGLALLLATLSSTGFLKALFALMAYFALKGQLGRGLLWATAAVLLGYALLSLYPDNYVFTIVGFMQAYYEQTGELGTGSFIDRFFGLAGPLSLLGHWHAWLGYGFGGDSVYFDTLFSQETAAAIREVKGDIPAISSLQGKMLMYGGLLGYGLYLLGWFRALRGIPRTHLSRVMVPAVFASSLFSLGPIFLPYVWLWLAVASTSSSISDQDEVRGSLAASPADSPSNPQTRRPA